MYLLLYKKQKLVDCDGAFDHLLASEFVCGELMMMIMMIMMMLIMTAPCWLMDVNVIGGITWNNFKVVF